MQQGVQIGQQLRCGTTTSRTRRDTHINEHNLSYSLFYIHSNRSHCRNGIAWSLALETAASEGPVLAASGPQHVDSPAGALAHLVSEPAPKTFVALWPSVAACAAPACVCTIAGGHACQLWHGGRPRAARAAPCQNYFVRAAAPLSLGARAAPNDRGTPMAALDACARWGTGSGPPPPPPPPPRPCPPNYVCRRLSTAMCRHCEVQDASTRKTVMQAVVSTVVQSVCRVWQCCRHQAQACWSVR